MFGPNVRATFERQAKYFHHREQEYRDLLERTQRVFRQKFNVSDAFDVIIMTGSGTLANEAVLRSLRGSVWVDFPDDGREFTNRLRKLWYSQTRTRDNGSTRHHAMVHYETGEGKLMTPRWDSKYTCSGLRIVDCVSSFPYYTPPADADVWTTVSSKQLGSAPVLGIVVVRSSAWRYFKQPSEEYSYMNLSRWHDAFATKHESPHTPAIALVHDLAQTLESFDVEALHWHVKNRRTLLQTAFEPGDVSGEGPVLIVNKDAIPESLARKWGLYVCPKGYQFFLYSGTDAQYEQFVEEMWRVPVNGDTAAS